MKKYDSGQDAGNHIYNVRQRFGWYITSPKSVETQWMGRNHLHKISWKWERGRNSFHELNGNGFHANSEGER